jgi:rhamnulose-1-phosphate aldolase
MEYGIEVIDGFIKLCNDGYLQGWHERNGGNLSYHLDMDEEATVAQLVKQKKGAVRSYALAAPVPSLANSFFLVTGSGRFMRNVILDPERNFGLIQIDKDGNGYRILWGLEDNAMPTSELPSHLLNHVARMSVTEGKCKVVYHAHPANITALSYAIPSDAKTLTKILWQSETECAVVFPEGIGILPWMVPGKTDIAIATSKLVKEFPAVVWSFHGVFCTGSTYDEAFGLMHTIEKAAEIYIKAKSLGIVHTITDDNLRLLAKEFHVTLRPDFLD